MVCGGWAVQRRPEDHVVRYHAWMGTTSGAAHFLQLQQSSAVTSKPASKADCGWDAPFGGLAELNVVDRAQHPVSDVFCTVFRFWAFF